VGGRRREFTRSAEHGAALASGGPGHMSAAGRASCPGEQPRSFGRSLSERGPDAAAGVGARSLGHGAAGDRLEQPFEHRDAVHDAAGDRLEQPFDHRDAVHDAANRLAAQLGLSRALGLGRSITVRFPARVCGRRQAGRRFRVRIGFVRSGRQPVGFLSPAHLHPARRLPGPARAGQVHRPGSERHTAPGRAAGPAAGRGRSGALHSLPEGTAAGLEDRRGATGRATGGAAGGRGGVRA
jgi:hypothetical protein